MDKAKSQSRKTIGGIAGTIAGAALGITVGVFVSVMTFGLAAWTIPLFAAGGITLFSSTGFFTGRYFDKKIDKKAKVKQEINEDVDKFASIITKTYENAKEVNQHWKNYYEGRPPAEEKKNYSHARQSIEENIKNKHEIHYFRALINVKRYNKLALRNAKHRNMPDSTRPAMMYINPKTGNKIEKNVDHNEIKKDLAKYRKKLINHYYAREHGSWYQFKRWMTGLFGRKQTQLLSEKAFKKNTDVEDKLNAIKSQEPKKKKSAPVETIEKKDEKVREKIVKPASESRKVASIKDNVPPMKELIPHLLFKHTKEENGSKEHHKNQNHMQHLSI